MFVITVLVLALIVGQTEGHLSPEQVSAALAEGTRTKRSPSIVMGGLRARYGMTVRGPYARVADAAAEAARKYLPFTTEDVTAEMTALTVELTVLPRAPRYSKYEGMSVHPPVEHVVIRHKPTGTIIQPRSVRPVPLEWSNAVGGQFQGQGMIGVFDLADLPPTGDLDFVAIVGKHQDWETLKAKDRARLK